ncbi:hypothetical protein K525DRAFT_201747 [Schizophyllum commune Loenen D]|nr:hypothetical protein K525DRAFT_201747 [Schizophyllum commune Loenen D]
MNDLPKPIDAEDEQPKILTVPRSVIQHAPEEIRQKVYESIRANLCAGRVSLYPAVALPVCVLSSLASSGIAGFTVRAVTRNVSIYGFLPGTWAEANVLRANLSLDELLEINRRLTTDPIIRNRYNYWQYGLGPGVALGLFRKVHVYPLPKGAFGMMNESACRLYFILETAFYLGGSLGVYYFYAEQFRSANVRAALLEEVQSIEQQCAWHRDYALTQASHALKIVATSSLLAIPTALGSAVNNAASLPLIRLYSLRAGFWGGLGLLTVLPMLHDLLVEEITTSTAIQQYRAALRGYTFWAWDKHILCGALIGGAAVPPLIKHAPTVPVMRDFVRTGKFVRSPRNIFIREFIIMLGGSLGSMAFIARHAAVLRSGFNSHGGAWRS